MTLFEPPLQTALTIALAALDAGRPIDHIVRAMPNVTNAADRQGNTLLHRAARLGRADAVWLLTCSGAAPGKTNLAGDRAVPLDSPDYVLSSVAPPRPRLVML